MQLHELSRYSLKIRLSVDDNFLHSCRRLHGRLPRPQHLFTLIVQRRRDLRKHQASTLTLPVADADDRHKTDADTCGKIIYVHHKSTQQVIIHKLYVAEEDATSRLAQVVNRAHTVCAPQVVSSILTSTASMCGVRLASITVVMLSVVTGEPTRSPALCWYKCYYDS